MFLSSLTSVAWCANMMLDRREQAPFTIEDLYSAADRGDLVSLLLKIDDSGVMELWAQHPEDRAEVNKSFIAAAEGLRDRELRKAGVGDNALCLVIAFALEAIQRNFRR